MAIDDSPETRVMKSTVAGESHEEHSLADRIAFERYKKQEETETIESSAGRAGLPIHRFKMRNGRP